MNNVISIEKILVTFTKPIKSECNQMTRKDYEMFAMIIATARHDGESTSEDSAERLEEYWWEIGYKDAIHSVMSAFITIAKKDNPRFDADKFLKACGF